MIMSDTMPKRILIVNTFGIGDVLFTTPLIRNIKENQPDCFLGFVCNQRAAGVLANNPYLDKVWIYEKDHYRDLAKISRLKCLKEFLGFLSQIRKDRFDLVLDLSLSGQVGFFTWLAGIKKRVGFNYKNRGWLLTDKLPITGYTGKHVVEFYAGLLKSLNFNIHSLNLEIFLTPMEKKWAEDFLKDKGVNEKDSLIAIVPGGGASWGREAAIKHWPAEKFAEIADKCIEKFKAKIIILGDYQDASVCNRVYAAAGPRAIQACGSTDIRQFAALLNRSTLAVTNDGGPLHVAVAAGTKTVSLFGPVDEKVYGPFPYDPRRHRVVKKELHCRPCYQRFRMPECAKRVCLGNINTTEVLKTIEELI
jgi:heptosyltransferase II